MQCGELQLYVLGGVVMALSATNMAMSTLSVTPGTGIAHDDSG
ncbi:MAG: hypothetical protein U5O16_03570 [Rhodococcus sp. (in: high G+C Gram-positive bacteria)]|nr:hypothetical protein [Rhodococcus sp. (in: high G+C Gram-positive bacteria)]